MIAVTQTELRNNIRKYIEAVKRGEEFDVYSHGKPVATVIPHRSSGVPSWKRDTPFIKLRGKVLASQMIIDERNEGM